MVEGGREVNSVVEGVREGNGLAISIGQPLNKCILSQCAFTTN